MKQITLAIIVVLTASTAVFGTIQIPDKLIYKGKEYDLHTNPLESYFKKYPDKRPDKNRFAATNLWRKYVATFEIIDNQLFLKDIEITNGDTIDKKGCYHTVWKSVLNEVFPNQELIKIDWFTGLLSLSYNEVSDYRYAYHILLEIENGEIRKEKTLGDYKKLKEFEEKQLQAFKETEEYEKIKAELKKSKDFKNKQDIDSFLQSFVIQYSSKILVEDEEE